MNPGHSQGDARRALGPGITLRRHGGSYEEDGEMQSRGWLSAITRPTLHRKKLTDDLDDRHDPPRGSPQYRGRRTNAYYDGNQYVFEEAAKLATTLVLVDIAASLRVLCADRPQHDPNLP
jgi:hypothetical protein